MEKRDYFFPLRGKDNLLDKIEFNKRTLGSLFKNKQWHCIFDKDFATKKVDTRLKENLKSKSKLGSNGVPFSHNGYCIESVIFSDIFILKTFIFYLVSDIDNNIDEQNVFEKIDNIIVQIKDDCSKVSSQLYKNLEESFNGQKNNRSEYENMEFNAFMRESIDNIQFIMNKKNIVDFIDRIECSIGFSLFLRSESSDEAICSQFLNLYFSKIHSKSEIYPSFISILNNFDIVI